MNEGADFECSFDEQHSRPQRFVYGAAPFATCTLMNQDQLVFHMSHVDKEEMSHTKTTTKAGTQCKSKAKVAHMNAFNFLKTNLTANLKHLCADQSADGSSDAERMLRKHWYGLWVKPLYSTCLSCRPDFIMSYDLWHKTYPFTKHWKQFAVSRTKLRGPFKYPYFQFLYSQNLLSANRFKSWW